MAVIRCLKTSGWQNLAELNSLSFCTEEELLSLHSFLSGTTLQGMRSDTTDIICKAHRRIEAVTSWTTKTELSSTNTTSLGPRGPQQMACCCWHRYIDSKREKGKRTALLQVNGLRVCLLPLEVLDSRSMSYAWLLGCSSRCEAYKLDLRASCLVRKTESATLTICRVCGAWAFPSSRTCKVIFDLGICTSTCHAGNKMAHVSEEFHFGPARHAFAGVHRITTIEFCQRGCSASIAAIL